MELLLYGHIGTYSMERMISEINAAESENLTIRINTDGGDPQAAFGLISKLKEFNGEVEMKVDGKAYSMGAFACLYANKVEALDVSDFMFHRAAFPSYIENDKELFTGEMKAFVNKINKHLRAAFESKINVEEFERIGGVSVDEMFSVDSRKDVFLTASEAKRIGLIDKINAITPERTQAISSRLTSLAASYGEEHVKGLFDPTSDPVEPKKKKAVDDPKAESNVDLNNNHKKAKKMTKDEFKLAHPEAYAAIVKEGIAQEADRIGAWAEFLDIDAEAVKEGIKSGEPITMTAQAKFQKKMFAMGTTAEIEEKTAKEVTTAEVKTEKVEAGTEKKVEANTELNELSAGLDKELGLNS